MKILRTWYASCMSSIYTCFWYAVPQAQSTEKGLAYRPKTNYSDLDQLLNADDVAAKSCIKSDMINTLYEAING